MPTTLQFNRSGTTYLLSPDGKAKTTKNGTSEEGTWSATSSTNDNSISVRVGTSNKTFPVKYKFKHGSGVRNALSVEVPKDGADPAVSAVFPGTIELDDEKDIKYSLPEGGSFILYGKLSFDRSYLYLRIEMTDGSETSIACRSPEIKQGVAGVPKKSTFLSAEARTELNGKTYEAKIGVFGNIVPKGKELVFIGSIQNNDNFDITFVGKYKLADGALQISSSQGKLTFKGAVRYQFDEATGSWGVMFGYSKETFTLSADLDFSTPKTDKNWATTLKGNAELSFGNNGKIALSFELQGEFQIKEDRSLNFSLKATHVNGKTSISFSGKVTVNDQKILLSLNYQNKTIELELAYETAKTKAAIRVLKDGKNVGIHFFVRYTFGGNGEQKPSEPKDVAA